MLESELLDAVVGVAHLYGWRCAHFRPAKTAHGWRTPVQFDAKGWPDLVLVRGHRMIAAELKSDSGHVTAEQEQWLADFAGAGLEAYVWRPGDLQSIAEVLATKNAPCAVCVSTVELTRHAASVGGA